MDAPFQTESGTPVEPRTVLPPATNAEFKQIILPWLSGTPDERQRNLEKAAKACKHASGFSFAKAVLRTLEKRREFAGPDGEDRHRRAWCHIDCRDMGKPDFAEYEPREKDPARSRTIDIFAKNDVQSEYVKQSAKGAVSQ